MAQNVDSDTLADFTLQSCQKLPPGRAVLIEAKASGHFRLGFVQEDPELDEVNAVLTVIVGGITADPARTIDSRAIHYLATARTAGCTS